MTVPMRIAVFLLLLANLLLFVWTQGYLGGSTNPDARRVEEQLLPERLRIVARDEPPPPAEKQTVPAAAAAPAPVATRPPAESCQRWSDLAGTDADQIEQLLGERFAAFKATRRTLGEITGYWVFIPPLASREEANKKTAELQELGVREYFIVPSSGSSPLAISLGTYRSEEAARTRLEALRAKGVRSARVGARKSKSALSTLDIRGPATQAEALRQAIVALLPKAAAEECQTAGEATP